MVGSLLEDRVPDLPSWWQAFDLAAFLRENGWPNVTPDTVERIDPFWIGATVMRQQVLEDPHVLRARKKADSRREKRGKSKDSGHLVDASQDAQGGAGFAGPEEIQAEVERRLRAKGGTQRKES